MSGSELAAIEEYIKDALAASSAVTTLLGTRYFEGAAPPGTVKPFVVYQYMSGNDLVVIGGARVWTDAIYKVVVVSQCADDSVIADEASAVDAALKHLTGGDIASPLGSVWSCVRTQPFRLTEQSNGTEWRHLGGLYRIYAS